jgi:hypothetical protein
MQGKGEKSRIIQRKYKLATHFIPIFSSMCDLPAQRLMTISFIDQISNRRPIRRTRMLRQALVWGILDEQIGRLTNRLESMRHQRLRLPPPLPIKKEIK